MPLVDEAVYSHEVAHAIAVAPYASLMTRSAEYLATTPIHWADRPSPSPVAMASLFMAGPRHDWQGLSMDEFLAKLFDEASSCQSREDAAQAVKAMQELSPEQVATAFARADWAARIARSVSRLNATGIAGLADAIESCSPGFGVLISERELVALVELRSPMWRQIVDFD